MSEEVKLNDVVETVENTDVPPVLIPTDAEINAAPPHPASPEWSDYVLKQFEEDEVIDGNPSVDGLRRVTKKIIGEIVGSRCRVIQCPNPQNDYSSTVEHEITIEKDNGGILVYNETADVTVMNCDPEFRRFASSTASTRAEARALRKALGLRKVVAAEEVTEVAPEDPNNPGMITPNQVNFMLQLCRRCNINFMKYINLGKTKYDNASKIPYATAIKMVGHLSDFQRNPEKIPEAIKGWEESK
jgi:hypothetical protein